MTTRERILQVALWWSVLGLGLWVGGTVYQMLVIVPIWSASPEALRSFWTSTDFGHHVIHFFGPGFMAGRNVPLIIALIAGWSLPHRKLLIITITCVVLIIVVTFASIYPINNVLFDHVGTLPDDQVRALLDKWILYDRIRFAIGAVGYLSLLRALSIPLPLKVQR